MTQIQKATPAELSKIGESLALDSSIKLYQVRISRERPGGFVFLIDQSGSMGYPWGNNTSKSKAELVALYVNNVLNEIINICQKAEPEPRPYFEVFKQLRSSVNSLDWEHGRQYFNKVCRTQMQLYGKRQEDWRNKKNL